MTATFYVGDVLKVLATLPENSVDLVLSSPPFLALRSYLPADHPDKEKEGGSQSTPGEYIDWLLDVVEACDRVLAPHGSLCFELGDTYSGSTADGGDNRGNERYPAGRSFYKGQRPTKEGWPLPKSLSLIPESFRFAMVYGFNPFTGRQTERWRLRNVIRWVRPNPPVGALGDKFRPATSELMVFCKSAKRYFDLDAVREPNLRVDETPRVGRNAIGRIAGSGGDTTNPLGPDKTIQQNPAGAPPLDWWNIPLLEGEEPTKMGPKPTVNPFDKYPGRYSRGYKGRIGTDGDNAREGIPSSSPNNPIGAPPLDWWNIPPGGYEGAHYAVWPPELLIKPIKAMCPEKVCRECGEARRRIVESARDTTMRPGRSLADSVAKPGNGLVASHGETIYTTLGFSDCGHNDYRPGLVLDPFVGSGTTLSVATGHGRDAIGIDLDSRNWDLALERVGPLVLQRGEVAA